jgi:hypothetical protein
VMVRSPRPGGIEAALKALNQDTKKAKEVFRDAVHSLLRRLQKLEPTLSPDLQIKIAALSEMAVPGRTHVPREGYYKEIVYVPEAEAATRLAQQLAQLAKGSPLLAGPKEVAESDYSLVRRVAFDCIPTTKRRILLACIAREELARVDIADSTRSYAEEDLRLQGLMNGKRLSDLARNLLTKAGVI